MIRIFISYSHKDDQYKDELISHLYPIINNYDVDLWHDRSIEPNSYWNDIIIQKLKDSEILLLLISADFLSSPYINANELSHAVDQHIAGKKIVIPIILRHCDWKDEKSYLGKIQAYPKDGKPITDWERKDEAYVDIILNIKKIVKKIAEQKSGEFIDDFKKKLEDLEKQHKERYLKNLKKLMISESMSNELYRLYNISYNNTLSELTNLVNKFKENDIIINYEQMLDFYKTIQFETKISFHAATYYKDFKYWTNTEGKEWLEGNKKLIEKKVKVERTFIIEKKQDLFTKDDNSEFITGEDLQKIIKTHIEYNIDVRIVVQDSRIKRFFDKTKYVLNNKELPRLGYVIYDKKYISFWVDPSENESNFKERNLIIQSGEEEVNKYLDFHKYIDEESDKNISDLDIWLKTNYPESD